MANCECHNQMVNPALRWTVMGQVHIDDENPKGWIPMGYGITDDYRWKTMFSSCFSAENTLLNKFFQCVTGAWWSPHPAPPHNWFNGTIEIWSSVLICFNVFIWSFPSKKKMLFFFRAKKTSLPWFRSLFRGSMAWKLRGWWAGIPSRGRTATSKNCS